MTEKDTRDFLTKLKAKINAGDETDIIHPWEEVELCAFFRLRKLSPCKKV